MKVRTRFIIGAAAAAGLAVAGGVAATAGGDSEQPITGDPLAKASASALEHTGEGKVSDTEVGDEESLYEVEVTLSDGSQVDVQLDADFNVVGDEADDENQEDN